MLDRLSYAGYKITQPRRRVLNALRAASEPLTALEIAERAESSVASTYRTLALLAQLGVVSEAPELVGAGDSHDFRDDAAEARGKRYALCTSEEHHHHFVCRECHATLEFTCDALEQALRELEASTGALIERHEVTLRGICSDCRSKVGVAE